MLRRVSLLLSLGVVACEGTAALQSEAGTPVDGVIGTAGVPKVTAFRCDGATVEATVPLRCAVEASHPRGAGLSCRLESSSGERVELGDCSSAVSTSVRLMTPGQATLTLVVADDAGLEVERTVTVEVLLPPNQLPRITRFDASRTTGVTPFAVTLTVDAQDPDSSDLRCELSPGGPVPCAMGQHRLDVTQRGPLTVVLTARDGRGGVATQVVTLTGVEPVGDVRVESLSFAQTVVAAAPRLVEGKPALLLASVVSDTAGLGNVVELVARRGGMELGRVRMTGPASPPTATAEVPRQYQAPLPADWVAPGLELTVRADATETLAESNEDNNELRVSPVVARRNVLHLTAVPVVVGGVTSRTLDLEDTMVSQWPLADVTTQTRAPYTTSVTPSGGDTQAWSALLGQVAQVRSADGSGRHYYGFVRVGSFGVAGIGYLGQPTAIGRDDNLGVASHELGHNFGRNHAPCGGAGGADPSYPYAGGRLGSWGWTGQSFVNPAQYVDLMSYCNPTWTSDYTYRGAQTFLERGTTYGPTPPQALVLEPSVLVAATVRGGTVTLEPVHALLAARTPAYDSGWTVRLTSTTGRVVVASLIAAELSESDEVHLHGVLEDVGPLASVEVLERGAVRARHDAEPVALSGVTVRRLDTRTVRIAWDSASAPFLSVAHLGEARTTLTLRATGGAVVLRHDGLEGGRLELSASSGVASLRREVPLR